MQRYQTHPERHDEFRLSHEKFHHYLLSLFLCFLVKSYIFREKKPNELTDHRRAPTKIEFTAARSAGAAFARVQRIRAFSRRASSLNVLFPEKIHSRGVDKHTLYSFL